MTKQAFLKKQPDLRKALGINPKLRKPLQQTPRTTRQLTLAVAAVILTGAAIVMIPSTTPPPDLSITDEHTRKIAWGLSNSIHTLMRTMTTTTIMVAALVTSVAYYLRDMPVAVKEITRVVLMLSGIAIVMWLVPHIVY